MSSKPWYASKAIWGGIIAAGVGIFKSKNIDVTDLTPSLINNWDAVLSFSGGILAIFGRLKAKQPISGTAAASTSKTS